MPVDFVAGGNGGGSFANFSTSAFTIGSQSNRCLFAIVTERVSDPGTRTVVWDAAGVNEALTLVETFTDPGDSNRHVYLYRKVNPTAGTSKIVTVTFSDAGMVATAGCVAACFANVDQTTPYVGWTPVHGNTGATASTTVSPAPTAADMVMDGLWSVYTPSVGANQTEISTLASPADCHWGSRQAGADGAVMSWSLSGSDGGWWIGAFVVKAAAESRLMVARGR